MNTKIKIGIGIVASIILLGLGALTFRGTCVTFIDNYELPFQYDYWSGKVELLDRTGYIIRNPLHYSVHGIDMRPYQVQINAGPSTNQRILNAKLVQFNPDGLTTFLKWHGRSAGDHIDELKEILKVYAFDRAEGRDCPFLNVLNQLEPSQAGSDPQKK